MSILIQIIRPKKKKHNFHLQNWRTPSHRRRFDRPLVKCYKSTFCAALVPRRQGASPALFGAASDRRAAASSWWNENKWLCGRGKKRSVEKVCRERLPRKPLHCERMIYGG